MVVYLTKDSKGRPGYFIFGRITPMSDGSRFEILQTRPKSRRPPGTYSIVDGKIINQAGQEVPIHQLIGEIIIQGSH